MKTRLSRLFLNGASAVGLVLLLLAAAGSKPNAGAGAGGDASTTTTTSGEADDEPKFSVSGKKVPDFGYIRGTCENVKKAGQCDEYYELIPKFAPDMCKNDGGNFVTSTPKPNPCPKEKLIGTCHYPSKGHDWPGQFANYYSTHPQSAAALKKECLEDNGHEWIDPPAAPAAAVASAPAAKAATPVKNATPAKAPTKAKTK